MTFHPDWFSSAACIIALIALAVLLCAAAKPAFAVFRRPAAPAAAALWMALLWSLTITPDHGQLAGFSHHLLGVNLAALMVGIPAAFWLASLLLVPYLLLHGATPAVLAPNILTLLLPALLMNFLFRKAVAKLPANLFIFIFLNGFICSAAGVVLTGFVTVGLLDGVGAFPAEALWQRAFPAFFLLGWGEAFLSGLFTATFVALKPHLLHTFDDAFYLKRRNSIWK